VVSVPGDEARDIYQADLALIRPDQIVAWRGNSSADAAAVLRQARRATAESDITSSSNQRT